MSDSLDWLLEWYSAQCDGEWEHSYGIRISTLDNPGWKVEIDLAETELSDLTIDRVLKERSEIDWVDYSVIEQKFRGYSGPRGLREVLDVFRRVAERGTS